MIETAIIAVENNEEAENGFYNGYGAYDEDIFNSLRKIVRAMAVYSHGLTVKGNFTLPQLTCILKIRQAGSINPSELARRVFLSQATITGIIDRLESKGLVQRERINKDRRRVNVRLTDEGIRFADAQPLPVQDIITSKVSRLPLKEQEEIQRVLSKVVCMLETGEGSGSSPTLNGVKKNIIEPETP